MTGPADTIASPDRPVARRVAVVLRLGTAAASILLATGGALMAVLPGPATTITLTAGCGLLVALPVVRLALLAQHFARLAHRRLAVAALAVLVLVTAGGVLGLLVPPGAG